MIARASSLLADQSGLAPDLFELLVDCTVAAVVAELRERGNPPGDTTEPSDEPSVSAGFHSEGIGRSA